MNCIKCGKPLTGDDIGLHKKFVNRNSEEFMCIDCLCERFDITREFAEAKIEFYRQQGCTLFV